jgi:hypothetical protein
MSVGARAALVVALAVVAGCSPPPSTGASSGAAGQGGAGGAAGQGDAACACPSPLAPGATAHLPLACLCGASTQGQFLCTRTDADLRADASCGAGETDVRVTGCGKVSYQLGEGYAGSVLVLSKTTGAVVGVYEFSDTPFGSCAAFGYVYGEGLFPMGVAVAAPADACAQLDTCALCGTPTSTTPACL